MDIAFAILVGALGIAVALFLAFRSNKVDDQGDNKKNRQQPKKQVSRGPRKIKAIQGPNLRSADSVETEDEEHTMLQFLRGTQEQIAKERKEENRKKARLEKKILEKNPAEDTSESSEEEGDEEYIIIKKKKTAEKEKKEGDKKGKKKENNKKKGGFFKPGVFKQIKAEQVKESEEAELEEANKPKKGKRKAEGEKSQESAPEKEKKPKTKEGDKPSGEQRPRKVRAPAKEGETEENKVEGEDGEKPQRASGALRGGRGGGRGGSFAPRKPREYVAPPSGPYEPASLDDMLTAISSFYGTSATPKKSFFNDIPRPALFKILRSLPLKDLLKLTLVNHFLLKTISKDDKLWKLLCERDFKLKFSSDKKDEKKRFRQVYVEEYKKTKQPKQPKPVAEVVA